MPFLQKVSSFSNSSQHIPYLILAHSALAHSPSNQILQRIRVVVTYNSDLVFSHATQNTRNLKTMYFLQMFLLFGEHPQCLDK